MDFISKLIARPKSLITSTDDMEQQQQQQAAILSPSVVTAPPPPSPSTLPQETIIEELLVQINDNLTNQASVALSGANQKQLVLEPTTPTNKQIQDFKQVGFRRNNEFLSENICNNSAEKKILAFADSNDTSLDSVVSTDLPIGAVKPLKSIGQSVSSIDESIGSAFDSLNTRTSDAFIRSKSLSVPLESESSGSHVSSDNETYVECRSFSPSDESNQFTSALDLVSIADSTHGWDELVTSVSKTDIDSLENINEQLDGELDVTPTECILNLSRENNIEPGITISGTNDATTPTGKQNSICNNDLANCILPEAVANLIENVDTNSCDTVEDDLEKCQELQIVPTTIDDLQHSSQKELSPKLNQTTEENEKDYCNNVTIEADDKAFSSQHITSFLSENLINEEPIPRNDIVLSWAKVEQEIEKLSASNNSEMSGNATQEFLNITGTIQSVESLDKCSSSANSDSEVATAREVYSPKEQINQTVDLECPSTLQEFNEFNTDLPLPEIPHSQLNLSLQFPVKTTQPTKNSFPQSPSQENLNDGGSPRFNLKQCSNLNKTIEMCDTSPNKTSAVATELNGFNETSCTDRILTEATSINCTFSAASHENQMEEPKFKSPTVLNQTYNGEQVNSVINETIVVENQSNKANETVTYEPMDVDEIPSPNPNKTVSYPDALPTTFSSESLSEKEKSDTLNEKDVFVENGASYNNYQQDVDDIVFKMPKSFGFNGQKDFQPADIAAEEDFQSNRIFLNSSDFDFLLTKGNGNVVEGDRSSLLLRFDPLLGHSVPVNNPPAVKAGSSTLLSAISSNASSTLTPSASTSSSSSSSVIWKINDRQLQQQQQQAINIQKRLSPANEEEEHQFYDNNRSFQLDNGLTQAIPEEPPTIVEEKRHHKQKPILITARSIKKNVKMSVDVMQDLKIENDSKSIEEIDTQTDIKQNYKMDELEKKIKNEVLKTEDIEKKLKEAEQREEALIKRITEKDKAIAKMNGVIEAYEKAIAELISEKEHLLQNYEKQLAEVKADRDSNYHHLTSLETTFSDLHVKYEKSKEMTAQLKSSEETLLAEKRQNLENLRLQEQRYEKMKNHAMQQLEIANKKLESLSKNHSMEITKLKALLKKEEISRASMTEQLQQKTRENEELVKICDELINGQGS